MENSPANPHVFHCLENDALEITSTAYGSTGKVYSDGRIEAVWVRKQAEQIDPGWFSQAEVDLLLVLHGQLMFEFEQAGSGNQLLAIGDLLVLPPDTRCRAYRWPRDSAEPAIFFAVYPLTQSADPGGGHVSG
jgi:hypothetical protein